MQDYKPEVDAPEWPSNTAPLPAAASPRSIVSRPSNTAPLPAATLPRSIVSRPSIEESIRQPAPITTHLASVVVKDDTAVRHHGERQIPFVDDSIMATLTEISGLIIEMESYLEPDEEEGHTNSDIWRNLQSAIEKVNELDSLLYANALVSRGTRIFLGKISDELDIIKEELHNGTL
jgi:hypothetical protein